MPKKTEAISLVAHVSKIPRLIRVTYAHFRTVYIYPREYKVAPPGE